MIKAIEINLKTPLNEQEKRLTIWKDKGCSMSLQSFSLSCFSELPQIPLQSMHYEEGAECRKEYCGGLCDIKLLK